MFLLQNESPVVAYIEKEWKQICMHMANGDGELIGKDHEYTRRNRSCRISMNLAGNKIENWLRFVLKNEINCQSLNKPVD